MKTLKHLSQNIMIKAVASVIITAALIKTCEHILQGYIYMGVAL